MNYATYDTAVSVFPKHTFLNRTFYVNSRDPLGDEWNPEWAKKYTERGFTIDIHDESPGISGGQRNAFDELCWKIAFSGELQKNI